MPAQSIVVGEAGCGSEALAAWRRVLGHQIEVQLSNEQFRAKADEHTFGSFRYYDVSVSEVQEICRTASLIEACPDPNYRFVRLNRGAAHLEHCGRAVDLSPGDCVLIDSQQPFSLQTSAGVATTSFNIPTSFLRTRAGGSDGIAGTSLSSSSPWGAALMYALESFDEASDMNRTGIADLVVEQIVGAAALAAGCESQGTPDAIGIIREGIAELYYDPGLTVEGLAAHVGMSKGGVTRMLAACGTTFRAELQTARLEWARAKLTDPRFFNVRIADLAVRAGFCDASHFSRCFKRIHHKSPGDFRSALN